MNINDTNTMLMFSTTRIIAQTREGANVATGFFFSCAPPQGEATLFLITCLHCLEGSKRCSFDVHLANGQLPSTEVESIVLDSPLHRGRRVGDLDLVAIPIASELGDVESSGKKLFYQPINSDSVLTAEELDGMSVLEQVVAFGYLCDAHDDNGGIPIARLGWVSTPVWHDFRGKREFLIDMPVFPGFSGSPVFAYLADKGNPCDGMPNRCRPLFIGVLKQALRRGDQQFLDLGVVIRSDAMVAEIDLPLDHGNEGVLCSASWSGWSVAQ